MTIQKTVEELKKEYEDMWNDQLYGGMVLEEGKAFLSQAFVRILESVEEGLPEMKDSGYGTGLSEYGVGFNAYRAEVMKTIKEAREELTQVM